MRKYIVDFTFNQVLNIKLFLSENNLIFNKYRIELFKENDKEKSNRIYNTNMSYM